MLLVLAVAAVVLVSGIIIVWPRTANPGSAPSPPPGGGVILGAVNGSRLAGFLASFPSQAAYSDQNSSYVEWVWQGATVFDNLTFRIPDPIQPSTLLNYSGLLLIGNSRSSALYAYLVVFGLVRNPLDDANVSWGVQAGLFIDARGTEPLVAPEAGVSVIHIYGYGSNSVPVWFDGTFWEAYSNASYDAQRALGTGYGISDGRNTTFIFNMTLNSPNPAASSLRLPSNTTWPLGLSVYLGFNVENGSASMPFQEPRSCWPNNGTAGNPDGFRSAANYLPFRVKT